MGTPAKIDVPPEVLAAFGDAQSAPAATDLPPEVAAAFGAPADAAPESTPPPQVVRQAPMKFIEPATDDRGLLEKYLSDFGATTGAGLKSLGRTALDAANGFNNGITLGHSDELAAGLVAPFSDKTYPELRDEYRAINTGSRARSPIAFNTSEMAGGTASTLAAPEIAGVADANLAQRIAGTALAGGAGGFVSGEGNSESNTPSGVLQDANRGMKAGALTGALVHGATELPGAARALAAPTRSLADEAATSAVGKGAGFKNVAERAGLDYAEEGMGARAHELYPHVIPKPAKWFAEQSGADVGKTGAEIGELITGVSKNEVPQAIKYDDFMNRLLAARNKYASAVTENGQSNARTVERLAKLVDRKYGNKDYLSPDDLFSIKRDWESVGFPTKANAALPSGQKQLVNQRLSKIPREELGTAMDEMATNESGNRYHELNSRYQDAKTINAMSSEKALSDARKEPHGFSQFIPGAHSALSRMDDARALGLYGASNAMQSGARFSDAASDIAGPLAFGSGSAIGDASAQYNPQYQRADEDPVLFNYLMNSDPEFRAREHARGLQMTEQQQDE